MARERLQENFANMSSRSNSSETIVGQGLTDGTMQQVQTVEAAIWSDDDADMVMRQPELDEDRKGFAELKKVLEEEQKNFADLEKSLRPPLHQGSDIKRDR